MKKRLSALALALVMVMSTVALAAGTEKAINVVPGITLTVDGQKVTPTNSAGQPIEVFASEGATYLPLRYLAEKLGMAVDWNQETMTASVKTAPAFEQTVDWAAEYDVIVVGLGAAGCSTAITAAQEGAKVLVLEKAPEGHAGGNSAVCMQWAGFVEDKEQAITYMKSMREGFQTPTDEMISSYVDALSLNEQWLKDLGAPRVTRHARDEFPDMDGAGGIIILTVDGNMGIAGPGALKGSGALYKFLKKSVEELDNVDIWYEAPGQHLIQDKNTGIVHGVQAEVDGKSVNIRARNGVVLACGGYEANQRMAEDYNDFTDATSLAYAIYNTGDGIVMAQEAGARLWHMSNLVGPNPGYRFESGAMTFGAVASNTVNLGADGTIYKSWGASKHGKAYFYGNYVTAGYPNYTWAVYDSETVKLAPAHNSFSEGNQWEIEHGYFQTGKTLEELAQVTGMPVDALKTSIEEYNKTAKDPIVKAPYYALRISHSVGNTQGGPERDTEGRVIDLQGNPIPHLYEAGELGDIWSHCYQASCNIGGGLAFGRISGKNAAAAKTDNYQGSVMEGKTAFAPTVVEAKYEAGADQYIGKGEGKSTVPITVRVTKKGDDITKVELLEFWDTPGFSDRAVDETIRQIVEKDAAIVDVTSGATMTSVGIMSAVSDALSQVK